MKKIKVAELFAGVGGFRLGLEGWNGKSASTNYQKSFNSPYKIIWSNQWEPSTKTQHASLVYENKWGKTGHSNQDIATVEVKDIPDHDLLVGGFPCQDYSVATTLKNSKGLIGKKGILWWSIHRILSEKKNKPKFLLLENVDRLLISPSSQRGRDFAIILQSLNELGYAVEWRVINAAEYGMPQRRRRVFIFAYHQQTAIYKNLKQLEPAEWLYNKGTIANAFPIQYLQKAVLKTFNLEGDIVNISNNFNIAGTKGIFANTGLMVNGKVTTVKTTPNYTGNFTNLGTLLDKGEIPSAYLIPPTDLDRWHYLKGAKNELRKKANGFEYYYKEGAKILPVPLDRPSRTIITGEGGKSPSRFKHVIPTNNSLRRLTPLELERLNMFPDNHTLMEGIRATKRAFFMGNALVVGVVEKLGLALKERL